MKLLKDGDTNPTFGDFIAPVNLTLHSLFKQVDVQIMQQMISSGQPYAYKTFKETLRKPDK